MGPKRKQPELDVYDLIPDDAKMTEAEWESQTEMAYQHEMVRAEGAYQEEMVRQEQYRAPSQEEKDDLNLQIFCEFHNLNYEAETIEDLISKMKSNPLGLCMLGIVESYLFPPNHLLSGLHRMEWRMVCIADDFIKDPCNLNHDRPIIVEPSVDSPGAWFTEEFTAFKTCFTIWCKKEKHIKGFVPPYEMQWFYPPRNPDRYIQIAPDESTSGQETSESDNDESPNHMCQCDMLPKHKLLLLMKSSTWAPGVILEDCLLKFKAELPLIFLAEQLNWMSYSIDANLRAFWTAHSNHQQGGNVPLYWKYSNNLSLWEQTNFFREDEGMGDMVVLFRDFHPGPDIRDKKQERVLQMIYQKKKETEVIDLTKE